MKSLSKIAIVLSMICGSLMTSQAEEVVNVYSLRQPELIKPIFDAFTKETGIKVQSVFAQNGLLERMEKEGRNSPADVLLTVDIRNLTEAAAAGLGQPIQSDVVNQNIPAEYRDPDGLWVGLTKRARILVASTDRVPKGTLTSYEDLAKPEWKGRICARSGKSNYNVALISSIRIAHGEEAVSQWLKGVKDNLARKPQGGDRDQIRAVVAGECDVAISNSYYLARLLDDPNEAASNLKDKVYVIFPNQQDRGTHVNISGALLAKHAPNKDNALKLIEFLSGEQAQQLYAESNREYPLKAGVPLNAHLANWGEFKADETPLSEIAKYHTDSVQLVDKVGFDQ